MKWTFKHARTHNLSHTHTHTNTKFEGGKKTCQKKKKKSSINVLAFFLFSLSFASPCVISWALVINVWVNTTGEKNKINHQLRTFRACLNHRCSSHWPVMSKQRYFISLLLFGRQFVSHFWLTDTEQGSNQKFIRSLLFYKRYEFNWVTLSGRIAFTSVQQ